jgi:tetratricopeptide (TPR) repeat protein
VHASSSWNRFASFLRNAASEQPIALVLDDLQAADAPSLLLLRFLSGQLTGAPILIVGCYRDTEVGPDLEEALAELSREPAVHRLSLKGLKESDTSRLLESITGDAPADDLAEQVHAETQGNPLFATEIGRLLASEGSGPRAPGALRIPEGIREAIGRRLRRQSDRCREVLALGSVVGREFDPEVIRRVSGLEQDELFAALDEAAMARLVDGVPETGGRLRFSHILIRDSLYENLSAPRRLRLHFEIAEALEALYEGNPEPHLAELAHHYLHAGTSVASKAIDYAERAGDRAASQYAYEEAARHYSSAIQGLQTIGSGSAERTCELLLSLGDVLSRAGTKEESRAAVRRAAELAEEIGRPDQLARAALQYGGRFAWARGASNPGLVPLLERAIAAVGDDDSQTRVKLLARLASASRDEPLRERRVRLADEALAIARREGDPATLAIALDGHWVATEGPDDTGHGITVGEELIALGEKLDDAERVFSGHAHRLHNFWELGDRAAVDFELDALRKLAGELDQLPQRWHLGADEAMLALLEGRFEDAEQLISQTLALGQLAESWNAVVTERLSRFVLRRAQGRLEELTDTIARSVHEYQTLPRFRCALAHLYAEVGREDDARAAFDAVLSRHIGREQFDAESLFTMTLLADPCAFLGDEDAATKLHSLLLPYEHLYARAPVEVGFGSVARALGVLATTLCHYDDAERHFGVAIEMERRMRARPWLAHAQHDFAAMLLARGTAADEKRAAGLLNDAVAAYRELGMETWAARAAALS